MAERRAYVWLTVAVVLLLLVVWAPIRAFRNPFGLLLIVALVVAGVELLRRQIAQEFPDARAPEPEVWLRDQAERLRAAARRLRWPGRAPASPEATRIDNLERLAALHERGALTDDEFAAEKAALRLGRGATAGVGGYAFVLAVALGGVGGSFLSFGPLVAMLAVGAAAVLATVVASVRARLEALQARTAALLARARFLADAGAVLDRSLNPDETLRQIASLAVPERAAMCVIDLAEEDGGVRGVAVEARDEELAEGMRDMRSRFPLDPDGPHPVARVLREERSTLIQLDDPMLSDLAARGEPSVARERSAFLAEAGVLLDQSLDFDTTLADLARLVVPGLADWCSIDVSDADGSLRNVVIAHRDPPREADAKRLLERYPLRPDLQVGAPQVIRTGSAEFLPSISRDVLERVAVDPEHRELIDALDLGSAIIVPLTARGRILGAVTLVTDGERRLEEADLTLALELGARAGLSVDNARLYGDRTHVAQTLQASLLPPQLPPVPGMRVAARYRPAGEGVEVGGDFYDVFAAGPPPPGVVVGGVFGQGPPAAAGGGPPPHTP